jgi:hypothetical protein
VPTHTETFMPVGFASRFLIGPYGLHAAIIAIAALLTGFVLVFNLTGFF